MANIRKALAEDLNRIYKKGEQMKKTPTKELAEAIYQELLRKRDLGATSENWYVSSIKKVLDNYFESSSLFRMLVKEKNDAIAKYEDAEKDNYRYMKMLEETSGKLVPRLHLRIKELEKQARLHTETILRELDKLPIHTHDGYDDAWLHLEMVKKAINDIESFRPCAYDYTLTGFCIKCGFPNEVSGT